MARWILSSGKSCIAAREPWPGMIATFHGIESDRCLFAKTFPSRLAAEQWRIERDVSDVFMAVPL